MEKEAHKVLKADIQEIVDALNRFTNHAVEYRKAEVPIEDIHATNDFTEDYSIKKSDYIASLSSLIELSKYYRNSLIRYSKIELDTLQEALSVTAK